jgi:hypothetical protein
VSTIREIKLAIEQLDHCSLEKLSDWFENYLAERWERRFATDVKAGRLDKLGAAADIAFEQGACKLL